MFASITLAPPNIEGPQTNSFFCSKGSVVVDFTMFFRGLIDQEIATRPLKLAIESGKLGDFIVEKDSLSFMSPTTVAPAFTSTPAGGLCCQL